MLKMKNLKLTLLLLTSILIVSCSKTEVTKQDSSELESVSAAAVAGLFKKRVLIEDFTGTWCGNCTSVAYAIEKVYENPNNQAVTVAIHSGNDPYKFTEVGPLHEYIFPSGTIALPEARLNRTNKWIDPDTNIVKALNMRSNNCGLGLALKSGLNDNTISLEVKIKFAQNYDGLKLVVYLLEDKLIYKQTNYSSYFASQTIMVGNSRFIPNFEHNHVLRKSLTNLLGNSISENSIDGNTISRSFSLAVPANIANKNNISFAAFVVDNNNTVINSRDSYINENQVFEENR